MKTLLITGLGLLIHLQCVYAQQKLRGLALAGNNVTKVVLVDNEVAVTNRLPLFSFQLNDKLFTASDAQQQVEIAVADSGLFNNDPHYVMVFKNISGDTVVLENVMPFTAENSSAYITGRGEHPLSRTYLTLPGKSPVNVIVPDNAWDLGYNAMTVANDVQLSALTRRDRNTIEKGRRQRFETVLYPGGSVKYHLFVAHYNGDWQNGLRHTFQDKMLYDVAQFNDNLFKRKDLQWIRHAYVIHLMDAWDKQYYDYTKGRYTLNDFIERGKKLYGGDDVVAVWPTWPTLGLDQRNQFDMYRDLPGGTSAMKAQAEMSRKNNAKFFICYNPWDESTRKEDHLKGLSQLIAETSADGVILDTRGESSNELQDAADKVRSGVVMYSEGMAVPKNMQGIVSGRVHNALEHPPMLNLNKFIKPDFAIFRVTEINKGKINREFATSFFNGYGTEINIMSAGIPADMPEQYKYLGKTSRILRENTHNFTAGKYTPLITTNADSIWVNEWQQDDKTIYTIFNLRPQGYSGNLFKVRHEAGFHYVDIWNHKLLKPDSDWIKVETDAFNASFLGTENEGSSGCIAKLPVLLQARLYGDELTVTSSKAEGEIFIWPGAPSYDKSPVRITGAGKKLSVARMFGRHEGDIIVQLMQDGILLDETVLTIKPGTPVRISNAVRTKGYSSPPKDMVVIPAGRFPFRTTHGDEFIGYPVMDRDSVFNMKEYYMDKYPVTNLQFAGFLKATKYKPSDTVNFLKHWLNGKIVKGQENYPVVYVSYEDAQAYAKWAGKRLPTEVEWQYAGQTTELREWPWEQKTTVTRKEEVVNSTLTVTSLEGIDSSKCNLGNGHLYPVGAYPDGISKFGLYDLVGCVWQLTNDVYETASHRYIIMKGGSYFKPSSSWWYVQSGPRELHYRQFLLRVSNGFERNATVGFRCVADKQNE